MKTFKKIIGIIDRTIGILLFVVGVEGVFAGDYKIASLILFIVSILFIIGYFTERWSN